MVDLLTATHSVQDQVLFQVIFNGLPVPDEPKFSYFRDNIVGATVNNLLVDIRKTYWGNDAEAFDAAIGATPEDSSVEKARRAFHYVMGRTAFSAATQNPKSVDMTMRGDLSYLYHEHFLKLSRLTLWAKLARIISVPLPEGIQGASPKEVKTSFGDWLNENNDRIIAIQRLDLSNNNLIILPTDLKILPPEIGRLTGLRSLNVKGQRLVWLPPEIGNLTGLTDLDLSANKLQKLPPEIVNLISLESFNLSYNKLVTLPETVGNLAALRNFNLEGNQLVALPSEIGCLVGLENLNLFNNQLVALPPEIGKLTILKNLNLESNQLIELPSEIGNLTGLEKLYLSYNQLVALSEAIGKLTGLTSLDLECNQLVTLPSEIGSLIGLKQLSLRGNKLKELPPEIGELRGLMDLGLSDNQLVVLPPEMSRLLCLQRLNLNNNHLYLPVELYGLNPRYLKIGHQTPPLLRSSVAASSSSIPESSDRVSSSRIAPESDANKLMLLQVLRGMIVIAPLMVLSYFLPADLLYRDDYFDF